jgi:hypothetical protein
MRHAHQDLSEQVLDVLSELLNIEHALNSSSGLE